MEEIKTIDQRLTNLENRVGDIHTEVKSHAIKDDKSHEALGGGLVDTKVAVAKIETRLEGVEKGMDDIKSMLIGMSKDINDGKVTDAQILTKVGTYSLIIGTIVTGAINYLFFG